MITKIEELDDWEVEGYKSWMLEMWYEYPDIKEREAKYFDHVNFVHGLAKQIIEAYNERTKEEK